MKKFFRYLGMLSAGLLMSLVGAFTFVFLASPSFSWDKEKTNLIALNENFIRCGIEESTGKCLETYTNLDKSYIPTFTKIFLALENLGERQAGPEPTFTYKSNISTDGSSITVTVTNKVKYGKSDVTEVITYVKKNDEPYKIHGFYLNSDAFIDAAAFYKSE